MSLNKKILIIIVFSLSTNLFAQLTKFTPKPYITNTTNYAHTNFDAQAELFGITSLNDLDTNGKSTTWIYTFYKPGLNDSAYAVTTIVILGYPIMVGVKLPPVQGTLIRTLSNNFCESNLAIALAQNGGGREFLTAHPGAKIIGVINRVPGSSDTSHPFWTFTYSDSVNNQYLPFVVDGITCSLIILGTGNNNSQIPSEFMLYQNYPNPFNPKTKISFDVPKADIVTVKVFDMLGNEVESLLDKNLQAGKYEITWNAENYSSGLYFCRIESGTYSNIIKMILLK